VLSTDLNFAKSYRAYSVPLAEALKRVANLPPGKPQPEPHLVADTTDRPKVKMPDFVYPINDD
jgi:hypothetical protein